MKKKKIIVNCVLAILLLIIPLVNFNTYANVFATDSLSGKARVLMDFGTGQIVEDYNSTKRLPIASVTKITTLLRAF